MKKSKKIGIALSVILVICLVIIAVASNVLFEFSLVRDSKFGIEKIIVGQVMKQDGGNANANTSIEYSGFAGTSEDKNWFNTNAKDLNITSDDGLNLHAYKIVNPNSNGKYMVVCHGYTSNAYQMARYIKQFYDMGFSVLAPDARAHGESEGKVRGMGYIERRDVIKWCNLLIDENKDVKIGLFGVSMGGATVMMTSGEKDLPVNVKVIVEDCGYSSVWDEFSMQMGEMLNLPTFPLLHTASITTKLRAGYSFKEASSVEQLKNCKTPILFVHGSADNFVPFKMLDIVYDAATCEKQKLVIEGAGHAGSSMKDPETYWNTVEKFVNEHID